MYGVFVAGGLAWFFLRESGKSKPKPTTPTPDVEPDVEPEDDGVVDFTKITSWAGEYSNGENVVWIYSTGIEYDDGTRKMNPDKIVIGNAGHTAFLRSSSDYGTIDIPKERTGGDTDQKNVQVFSSIESASKKVDELANPTPPSPTDPQKEPEDDEDEPSQPSFPTRPGFPGGLGGQTSLGDMTPTFNGGV